MNQPYVKHRDENGKVTNPITEGYKSEFPNRRERRMHKNQPPFCGNGKNFHLTITEDGRYKYKRVRQIEFDKDGDKKILYHYITH